MGLCGEWAQMAIFPSKRLCGRGRGEQQAHVQGSGEALSRGYGLLFEAGRNTG